MKLVRSVKENAKMEIERTDLAPDRPGAGSSHCHRLSQCPPRGGSDISIVIDEVMALEIGKAGKQGKARGKRAMSGKRRQERTRGK
jgi:hypothetical protein